MFCFSVRHEAAKDFRKDSVQKQTHPAYTAFLRLPVYMRGKDSQSEKSSHISSCMFLLKPPGRTDLHGESVLRVVESIPPGISSPSASAAPTACVFLKKDASLFRMEQDSFSLSHGTVPHGTVFWQEGNAGHAPLLLLTLLLFTQPS